MRVFAITTALCLTIGLAGASRTDYLSVKKKFQSLEKQTMKPGTRVAISAAELNAYVQTELPEISPRGIRDPRVELQGGNVATGRAIINFLQLRTARGKETSWMMRKLLEGEREVAVTTHVTSGGGKATVDVQRVEVSGIPIQGAALDFLIENYLIPNYPDVKIGRPFALHKRIDRIEVQPGVAYVVTR